MTLQRESAPRPDGDSAVIVELYTSAFCGACHAARSVLERVAELVPSVEIRELDVAFRPVDAEAAGIRMTPTVVVRRGNGDVVFRAEGAPSLPQALAALALAMPPVP
ncbi:MULTISPECIES: glutaredoxin family protein [unclassified Rathayibacter]|uniref:glutaredoxin family protein n=1 Tax=unclassified Rathayibacter TaxID=2609250 RepID=UPI00188ABD74|nr:MULTISPECIES: thioredoxin family protein [unclassified Rathayibacter]MBF4461085.1 thioredoxin family protein [Rathayibacter sp. VKM Ac-2879]MBF4502496.1 thioredoxin family protein [Rathayibacter sp. VKM Ac-2878]